MVSQWGAFCTETDENRVLEIAEKMVSENVDFKFYQNYFLNEESSLIRGKDRMQIKAFVNSGLYKKLRDLGDILGFRQGYVKPAKKKTKK